MLKRIWKLTQNEESGLHQAAFFIAISTVLSQLLGLLRDRLFANQFGAGNTLDVYYASFKVPDLVFVVTGSFLAVTVLIPLFIERLERDGVEKARDFLSRMLSSYLVFFMLVIILVMLSLPALVSFVVPGFSEADQESWVGLSRLLLLSPLFLGISNLLSTVTQANQRFVLFSISPILYNLCIIFGTYFFYPVMGIWGLALGVALGAVLHAAIQIPFVKEKKLLPIFQIAFDAKELRSVALRSVPRSLALGASQLSLVALLSLASTMVVGSISIFTFAYNLQSVPMAIIGVSYSVAAFTTLSRLALRREMKEFLKKMSEVIRQIVFWSLPVMVLFIVLRAQIVRVILGSGQFGWEATKLTAAALALFSISVVFQNLIAVYDRAFYALTKTFVPVAAKVAGAIITVALALILSSVADWSDHFVNFVAGIFRVSSVPDKGVLYLAFAFSVGTFANYFILAFRFRREVGRLFELDAWQGFAKFVISTLACGLAAYVALQIVSRYLILDTFLAVFMQGLVAGIVGLIVWYLALKILSVPEVEAMEQTIVTRIVGRPSFVIQERPEQV